MGIAFVGATLGYMVGGSETPIAKYTIPLIFSLAAMAIGLLRPRIRRVNQKNILEGGEKDKKERDAITIELPQHAESAQGNVGIALTFFCILYLAGTVLGGIIRIEQLFTSKKASIPFVWQEASLAPPPSLDMATQWISLQYRLMELGYKSEDIHALYRIYLNELAAIQAAQEIKNHNAPKAIAQKLPNGTIFFSPSPSRRAALGFHRSRPDREFLLFPKKSHIL